METDNRKMAPRVWEEYWQGRWELGMVNGYQKIVKNKLVLVTDSTMGVYNQ